MHGLKTYAAVLDLASASSSTASTSAFCAEYGCRSPPRTGVSSVSSESSPPCSPSNPYAATDEV